MPARRTAFMVLALSLTLSLSCTSGDGTTPTPSPRPSRPGEMPSGPTATPDPAVPAFELRAGDATGEGEHGVLHRGELEPAVAAVGATLSELYTIGFLDPAAWDEGRFTSLFRLFEADVRDQAHEDLRRLTLGPLWRSVEEVRPAGGRFDVRFLADAAGRPVLAIADVGFAATARAGESRGDLAQTGEFVLRKTNGAWRIAGYRVRSRIPERLDAPATASSATFAPGVPATRPTFILVIGSDARPRQAVSTTRADSLHIVGIDPRQGLVSVLGIPRDSWVPIPGHGVDKINASLADGGAELVVETVERLTGIPIDAYLLTGFDGFVRGVAAIGGLDVTIPYAISDHYAHAQFRPGREHLGGKNALAFARARHDLPNGDFGRSLNQGRLLLAALATLRAEVRDGSAPLLRWALAGAEYLKTDLALEDLFELVLAAPTFDPARGRNRVVTGRVATISGKSVVLLDANAGAMFRDLARDGVLGG